MARIDLARRAEIGREKRARTRAQIVEAGAMLLAERAPEALTVDAVVEAAGVAKGTFYYHFQSMEELAAAVGEKLLESFETAGAGQARPAQILSRACPSPLPNSWKRRSPTPFGRSSWSRARRLRPSCPERSRQSQGGSRRGEGSGAPDHAGRRAGGRHRLGHLAWGHARHSSATGRARTGRRALDAALRAIGASHDSGDGKAALTI